MAIPNRAMFKALAESHIVAQIQYCLKIAFIGIALLFVDAIRAMLKIEQEGQLARESGVARDLRGENDYRSRKFLSQRNFYLTGFTLFLSLVLSRVYSLCLDLLKAQEDLAILQTKTKNAGGAGGSEEAAVAKKQLADLQKEYDALSAKVGQSSDKKKD
ncbi:hypothetical protein MNV49_006010 [Pseudohyphozyma bogoriensis]|nr:hypothetical protein MNV49_006010 [Pseudohyphozyma bogoriensis]